MRQAQWANPWGIATSETSTARRIAFMGILLAISLVLQGIESFLPPPGIPGAKWGLANVVTLMVLLFATWKEALFLVVLRQVVGGAITGKLLSLGFLFGLSGGIASILVMAPLLFRGFSRFSIVGVSIVGAIFHNWGQWLVAGILVGSSAVIFYLPLLTLVAVPCGAIVGLITRQVAANLGRVDLAGSPFVARDVIAVSLAALIAFSVPVYWQVQAGPLSEGDIALVTVAGKNSTELSLSKDGIVEILARNYHYAVEIKDGRVRVKEADCPDQVCVKTGWINRPGRTIVCAPGQIVIEIRGRPGTDGVDAVLK
ncbi:MAG: Gx transporter family protein [Bacillota bacterium]